METILCILLYLGAICSPCEYYEHEIDMKEDEYHEEIQNIKNDDDYLDQVIDDYEDDAEGVTIKEDNEIDSFF